MTLEELELKVSQLPPRDLAEFREWFLRFDGDRWDEQIEKDAGSGKLDSLAQLLYKSSEVDRPTRYDSPRDVRFLGMLQSTSTSDSATCE